MKNLGLIFLIMLFALSCKKEEVEVAVKEPEIIQDQGEVENLMIDTWTGEIKLSNGFSENMEVTISPLKIGERVAEGKYFDPTFSCGFDWTYESFANGRVTFREKTRNRTICLDNLPIIAHFEDNDLDILHIFIPGSNGTALGELQRKQ